MMKDQKRYVYEKGSGALSDPVNLRKDMDACARNLKVGDGAFVVTRGGHYHHPDLSREESIIVTRECLRAIPIGSGVVVRNAKGDRVFESKRVPVNPYRDPFRDCRITQQRIDAGVDYGGNGPVYALGPGIITNVGTPSHTLTFGNDMAVYQLTAGPAKSKYVYFAEQYDTAPGLHRGQHVDSDTVLYNMNGFIEIGWSDGRGSMAWDIAPNSIEGQRTAWGENFSDLLESVDCPPGLTLGRAITMTLPGDWPDWRAP